ncbi:MAG TPA: primosomal protein N' [Acidobacteriaceae bacterium]|nr:primosomal protein N' [Acidobacteriaceae bacterium]
MERVACTGRSVSLKSVPAYCDVALPVPLDRAFTYAVNGVVPPVGARVLVPFSGQRLMGVVVRLHDEAPADEVEIKPLQQVLDLEALLPDSLMRLAEWIAQYYVAPLGEVLRGMLPLAAEVRRQFVYRIAEAGRRVLYEGAERGASRRSKLAPEDQNREYAVLNYLEDGHAAKLAALRSATQANKALLDGMVKKKWLVREAVAEERDARRLERIAVLVPDARIPKLNANQTAILAELAAAGGRMRVSDLRESASLSSVPQTTLSTLVKRGLVAIEEAPEAFALGGVHAEGKKHAHEHALNEPQMEALSSIAAAMAQGGFHPILLYGVTGSGKTSVYFAAMQRALDSGKSALLLVPEIGLTPAMAGQLHAAFGAQVALLHSALTPDERAEQWHRIRRGEARVVVGTRSAVFAPMTNLGLILVDEEHDSSYKQEETPRYHGRDVAVMRAKFEAAVVVLGSATPSLESWRNADLDRYQRVEMTVRVANRPLPEVELIDMREEFRATGQDTIFSRRMVEEVGATLARGEQVMVLLNRRGYSFTVLCRSCGEKIECENCAIALTYHKPSTGGFASEDLHAHAGDRLVCHYCGFRRSVPKTCPKCASEHLYYLGAGSQQGEERLQELFPSARIGRMDRDTVRGRGDMERLLARLHSGEINLLVGTQMIAKGHDVHGVTLVGVVGADSALALPDFRAAERVFQLLTQVSGRAGRGELPGRVLVQTYNGDHYAVRFAAEHDYRGFVEKEMYHRRPFLYPPFGALANVVVQGESLEQAAGWSQQLARWFHGSPPERVRVMGPAQAPLARLKRVYRFHFVLKAERREALGRALRAMLMHAETLNIPRRNLIVDVDAVHLM